MKKGSQLVSRDDETKTCLPALHLVEVLVTPFFLTGRVLPKENFGW